MTKMTNFRVMVTLVIYLRLRRRRALRGAVTGRDGPGLAAQGDGRARAVAVAGGVDGER
jgi:hypothetical protein